MRYPLKKYPYMYYNFKLTFQFIWVTFLSSNFYCKPYYSRLAYHYFYMIKLSYLRLTLMTNIINHYKQFNLNFFRLDWIFFFWKKKWYIPTFFTTILKIHCFMFLDNLLYTVADLKITWNQINGYKCQNNDELLSILLHHDRSFPLCNFLHCNLSEALICRCYKGE